MTYFAMERENVCDISDAELSGQLFGPKGSSVVQKLATTVNELCGGDKNE